MLTQREVALHFVASDEPQSGKQIVTVSGAGLTWKLVAQANTRSGDAEILQASVVMLNDTAPPTEQWNMAAVELIDTAE